MLAGKLPHCYWDSWRLPSAHPPLEPCPTLSHSSETTRLTRLRIRSCFKIKIRTMYQKENKWGLRRDPFFPPRKLEPEMNVQKKVSLQRGLRCPPPPIFWRELWWSPVLWICIGFNADPDPAIFFRCKSGRGYGFRVLMTKNWNKLKL